MAGFAANVAANDSGMTKRHKLHKTARKGHLHREDILSLSKRAEEEPTTLVDHSAAFAGDSTIQLTWGKLISEPMPAVSKVRRYESFRVIKRRTSSKRETKSCLVPVKEIYPLLSNLPMELREIIYGYILIFNGAIILHSDWYTVQNNAGLDLAILRVCKHINLEATRFLYQHNVFYALVRSNKLAPRFKQCIFPIYVPLFRHAVIECLKEDRNRSRVEKTGKCIDVLVRKETILHSLTLIIMPEVLSTVNPATGAVKYVTTFADFFAKGSKVMNALMCLQCKALNLVIKLREKKKVVVSVDLRYLECNFAKCLFANDQANEKGRTAKIEKTKADLMGLGRAVEMIASNWEEAVRLGVGRLMEGGEE